MALLDRTVHITCGTGGVGKTTLSAALGMSCALKGKKVLVITVDPAKRLASALGLPELSHEPLDLTDKIKPLLNGGENFGSYSALIPSTQHVFENFVKSLTSNPDAQKRLMENPLFKVFSSEYSGANEYMALERLSHFYSKKEFDVIVLDTPPSRAMLKFLDAPKLLQRFFDERLFKYLIEPANHFFGSAVQSSLKILSSLTGSDFMNHLFEFAKSLLDVRIKFLARLQSVSSLLESPEVGFFLVTTPRSDNHDEMIDFAARLQSRKYNFDGVLWNRSLDHLNWDGVTMNDYEMVPILRNLKHRADSQSEARIELMQRLKNLGLETAVKSIPEQARDIHSLGDLLHVARTL